MAAARGEAFLFLDADDWLAPDALRRLLAALATALRTHEAALIAAVDADFGGRPAAETRLLELLPLYDQIGHARRHLGRWMRRRRVAGSAVTVGTGVVG